MGKQKKNKYFNINTIGGSIQCKIYFSDTVELQNVVLFGHGFGGHKDNQAAAKFAKRVLEKNRDMVVMIFTSPVMATITANRSAWRTATHI